MILQRKPTNNDFVEKIQDLFLVLQSIDSKWTTPEIISNAIKSQINEINADIEKQVETVTNETFDFLTNIGALEKGLIDDKVMKDHYNKQGYKMCVDFSLFQLKYKNGQLIKKDIGQYNFEIEQEQ